MGLTTNPVALLHRTRFMCREQTFPGTLKSAKRSLKWTSYCVTWRNNHVHLYVAGVRVTDSGKLLPANWWPIRTQRGVLQRVYMCVRVPEQLLPGSVMGLQRGTGNRWLDHTILRKSSSQPAPANHEPVIRSKHGMSGGGLRGGGGCGGLNAGRWHTDGIISRLTHVLTLSVGFSGSILL